MNVALARFSLFFFCLPRLKSYGSSICFFRTPARLATTFANFHLLAVPAPLAWGTPQKIPLNKGGSARLRAPGDVRPGDETSSWRYSAIPLQRGNKFSSSCCASRWHVRFLRKALPCGKRQATPRIFARLNAADPPGQTDVTGLRYRLNRSSKDRRSNQCSSERRCHFHHPN